MAEDWLWGRCRPMAQGCSSAATSGWLEIGQKADVGGQFGAGEEGRGSEWRKTHREAGVCGWLRTGGWVWIDEWSESGYGAVTGPIVGD
jgi:hypothetical protein